MIQKIISRNKKKFTDYNCLRLDMFTEFSPGDSEIILYLLPWLLSINHPDCPGYIVDLETVFRVFGINNNKSVKKREKLFKEKFGVDQKTSLIKPKPEFCLIQGLYTIGSVGTISQTSESDCDIWVCYDKNDYNKNQMRQLNQKIYLIREWIDENCKIPVFFFVSEVHDIRNCRFGTVDEESSGSAQAHVLKEEFYRTCMVIAGKIPLWWVCYSPRGTFSYEKALESVTNYFCWDDAFIDLGNLENVGADEYFGAALWQIQKSLERPLKSIIKMLLLKMQLDAPDDELVCHKFRQHIMIKKTENIIPDPSIFSMFFLMNYYHGKAEVETAEFIKECYYLRCDIKPYTKKFLIKKKLANIFFKQFEIDKSTRERLSRFSNWTLDLQIKFGRRIFMLLLEGYRGIVASHAGVSSRIGKKDLTVVGRKIQVYYEPKDFKILILPKSTSRLNVSGLTFMLRDDKWHVYSGNDKSGHIVMSRDIVFTIAFVVRNQLFEPGRMHMIPNSSTVTLSEIINLGALLDAFFLKNKNELKNGDFLKKAYITKIFVVISFEQEPWEKNTGNIRLVYMNSWGELFVQSFGAESGLKKFLKNAGFNQTKVTIDYYLQKKCLNYPEILNDVKTNLMKCY